MGLAGVIDDLGGFASRRQLLAAGATDRGLTAAVRFGLIRRVRNGWYSTADPADPRFRAVRVGGRLTGLSAFESWGGWVWMPPDEVHIAVPPNAARLRPQAGVRIHYDPARGRGTATAVSIHDAMVRVLLDEPPEVAVPCVDWALRTGRADRIDVERCRLELPRSRRAIGLLVDRRSQSVLESVARVRLLQDGFQVESQGRTGLFGATDLVIEGTITLETDGREHHAPFFERDRRRDLVTTIEGRHVLRASASMVRDDWPVIVAAIRSALRARGAEKSGKSISIPDAAQRTKVRRRAPS